jgi:redox-sensitive bicupin YhaK (pirin superfamily)
MSDVAVLGVHPLGFQWETSDPFLFCVHHDDAYPAGNEQMGPAASLAGRNIGQDFEGIDGWRMYHGDVVPGFPQHPHRGFETITLARRGFIDHSDSLGATARFGKGDVQWMTAGKGIVHAEMFPLRDRATPNPVELFQIWLNLPSVSKMVDPYFTMMWGDHIPTLDVVDPEGRHTSVTVVAGRLGGLAAPAPPPSSWASHPDSEVAIWTIRMQPHATWQMPPASRGVNRTLYLFAGQGAKVAGNPLRPKSAARVVGHANILVENGPAESELLMLQGRPIGEPVAHYGPFVMNTRAELQQAFDDYQRTRFGGWPWPSHGPVHAREQDRFAIHADGRREDAPV